MGSFQEPVKIKHLIENATYRHDRKIEVAFEGGETFIIDMTKVSTQGYYPEHPPSLRDMAKFKNVEVSPQKDLLGWPDGYYQWANDTLSPIGFGAEELFFWGSNFSEDIPFDPTVLYFLEAFSTSRKLTQKTLDRLKAEKAPESFIAQLTQSKNKIYPRLEYFLNRNQLLTEDSKRAYFVGLLEQHLRYVDNFKNIEFLFAHSAQLPSNFYEEVIYVLFVENGQLYEVHGSIIDSCDPIMINAWNPVKTSKEALMDGINRKVIGWIEGKDSFTGALLKTIENL